MKACKTAEIYPGKWKTDPQIKIQRTLVKNGVTGCGYMAYKPRYNFDNEFLVYCSMDYKTWTAYIVWDVLEKLEGPYPQPGDDVIIPPNKE